MTARGAHGMTGERVDDAQEWLSPATARCDWTDHAGSLARAGANAMTLALAAAPESVREAREFARTGLVEWGLATMYDEVGLVVSELVTNALRHAMRESARAAD